MAKKISKLVVEMPNGDDYEFMQEGGAAGPDSIGSDEIRDGGIKLDDLSDEVKEQLAGNQLTDDDLENIFFPPEVTAITSEATSNQVVLTATAENIEDEESVTWHIDTDGEVTEIDSTGTSLTLNETQAAKFRSASVVKVRLECSDYESEWFDMKD